MKLFIKAFVSTKGKVNPTIPKKITDKRGRSTTVHINPTKHNKDSYTKHTRERKFKGTFKD